MSNDLNSGTVGGFGHMGSNDPYGGGNSGGTPNGHGGSGATGGNAGTNDSALLLQSSAAITDLGERYATKMSAGLKNIANEIGSEIKAFSAIARPAKTLRSTEDALKSLQAILNNPSMMLTPAELQAVDAALQNVNAYAIANNLENLSKAFAAGTWANRINDLYNATRTSIKTGSYGPLMNTVEGMVMSASAEIVGLSAASSAIAMMGLVAGPELAVGFVSTVGISVAASYINADTAAEINKTLSGWIKH